MTRKILGYMCVWLAIIPCVAYSNTLLVTVSGVKAGKGNLRVAVFDEAHRDEFPEGEYLRGVEVPATGEEMTVETRTDGDFHIVNAGKPSAPSP